LTTNCQKKTNRISRRKPPRAGLIALGELEATKRADIIARVIAESGR